MTNSQSYSFSENSGAGSTISIHSAAPASAGGSSPSLEEELRDPGQFLYRRFGLLPVPEIHCEFADLFRSFLLDNPTAIDDLCEQLSDEKSGETVRLGMERLLSHPTSGLCKSFFHIPASLMTVEEQEDWARHCAGVSEQASRFNHVLSDYQPTEFYYHHGLIYLEPEIIDRLAGGIFFDCGAYDGASSLIMSYYRPAEIVAFEPSAANLERVEKALRDSGISTPYRLVQSCTGNLDGEISFRDDGNSMASVGTGDAEQGKVPVCRLDTYMSNRNFGRVAWIKADLEGAALDMMKGAEETIKRHRPLLTIGIYHSPAEFFELPALLRQWVPEYKFLIRRCQCNPFVTYNELTLIAFV